MKRSRFSEEQIVAVLREQEAGISTADVCRKCGISSATFYAWKAKFGGMDVSEAKRLKALEDENAKLKRLLADAMLDNVALKDLLSKNGDARRQAGSRRSSHQSVRDERAAGAHSHQGRPQDGALPIATGG
jgi:putative transposase